jgi:PAS domain S-box-containing protein
MRELLASLPAAVAYLSAPDLVIEFANDACFRLAGDRDLLGRPLPEALPELAEQDAARVIGQIMQTGKPVSGSEARVRFCRRGRTEERFVDYAYQPVRDAGGDIAGTLLYAWDVTAHVRDRQRLEAVAAQLGAAEGRLRTLFDTMPPGVVHYSADGSVLSANPAAREILGLSEDEMTTWPLATVRRAIHEDGTPFQVGELPVSQVLRTGAVAADVIMGIPHGQTGEIRWAQATAVPDARDDNGRPQRVYVMFTDVTEQRRAAAALVRERAARTEADSARERLGFLMRAGALVAATRDRDDLLDQVAQLLVPSLADYCVVFLPTADGKLCASALAHADPARASRLAALREHPVPTAGPLMSQAAYTTGITQLARDVRAELPSWAAAAPEMSEIVASVDPHSALATPLLAGQRTLGVMVMGRGHDRPRFASSDVEVVEEIARRLAVGLANTDTFAREHAIAETLQRSVLPDTLPQIPGLDLAVRYLPATEGADVGGDWYDAFSLPDGRVALVTGDVAGHSISSASIMGQARSMLRAYAIDNPQPSHVLRRTNTALTRLLPNALTSVVYAVLDPATGDLSYANAGHPPPLAITGAGQAEYLDDTAGTMLGACPGTRFTTRRRRLPPGAGLLCYTDGLIEDRRRDITEGLAALAQAVGRAAPASAEQMCVTAQSALLGTAERADDVCLLAARLSG